MHGIVAIVAQLEEHMTTWYTLFGVTFGKLEFSIF